MAAIPVGRVPLRENRRALRTLSLVLVLGVWQTFGPLKPRVLSYPSEVLRSAWDLAVVENRLLPALLITLQGLSIGFLIAAVLGVALGFAMGRVRLVELALYPYMMALHATPRIALVPLLVLWCGIDLKLRVVVVVMSAIFPILINTYNGARRVDRAYLETAEAFAATPAQVMRTVVAPASVPYVFAGLRIGIIRALIGVIVAEMTASTAGTGRLIIALGSFFQTGRLLVPIVLLGILGIALSRGMQAMQDRIAPWATTTGDK